MSVEGRAARVRGAAPILAAAFLVSAILAAAEPVAAQEVSYSGSAQYSTGSYVFADRTHSFYFTSGLSARTSRFEVTASIPLILQNSAAVSYVRETPVPTGGPDHGAVRRREPGTTIPTRRGGRTGGAGTGGMNAGLLSPAPSQVSRTGEQATDSVAFRDDFSGHVGDPFLHGAVELHSGFGFLRSVRVDAGAKVPVAELESGVGTGRWDYQAGASVMLAAADVYVFGDLSWWWLGDLPGLELRDGPSYGLGVGWPVFRPHGSILATLSGARSSIATVEAPLAAGLSAAYSVREGRSLSLGASVGLTESSPDFSIVLGWTVDL